MRICSDSSCYELMKATDGSYLIRKGKARTAVLGMRGAIADEAADLESGEQARRKKDARRRQAWSSEIVFL